VLTQFPHRQKGARHRALAVLTAAALAVSGIVATSAAAAAPSVRATTPATGIPYHFRVATASFATTDRGYVVGTSRDQTDSRSPALLTTADGGTSWNERGLPDKHLKFRRGIHVYAVPGESELGSATLYLTNGRWLFATHDGGDSWGRVRVIGSRLSTHIGPIAITPDTVYAVVGDGPLDTGRSRLLMGSTDATELRAAKGVETEGNAVNVDGGWDVVANGNDVAVALGRIFVSSAYWTSSDGKTFTESDPACTSEQVTSLGSVAGDRVTALCSYNPGMGHQFKDFYVSDGKSWTGAGPGPELGLTQQYVSPRPGVDVFTAISGASIIYYRGSDGVWKQPVFVGGGRPFADLQFVDGDTGFVVFGGPTSHAADLYRTTDGGVSWAKVPGF
jgi:photosystem II stability/assembly factor-like uncharacterized protein